MVGPGKFLLDPENKNYLKKDSYLPVKLDWHEEVLPDSIFGVNVNILITNVRWDEGIF